jgi:hypothetical protein
VASLGGRGQVPSLDEVMRSVALQERRATA